jgi:hypothetical protein
MYDPTKVHVASLPTCRLCCMDGALVEASRQDNTKKSLPGVMVVMPKLPTTEITSQ